MLIVSSYEKKKEKQQKKSFNASSCYFYQVLQL